MVLIALVGILVCTETFALGIVVVICGAACPSVTLDAEMVVALACQFTPARPRLKYSLGERYAGGDAVFHHLFDGNVLILVYIFLIGRVPLHLCMRR